MSSSRLFCLVGPSGSGKSTLCKELLKHFSNLKLSISTTTRAPRGEEKDGAHYFFVSKEEFEKRISTGFFIEYAQFGSNLYGTEKRNIQNAFSQGFDLLLDIEVQGVLQLRKLYKELTVVFVAPPSKEILTERLRGRKDTSEEEINKRLKIASEEMHILIEPGVCDYIVVNNELPETLNSIKAIISNKTEEIEPISQDLINKIRF